jgi:uncharacterized membrane protein
MHRTIAITIPPPHTDALIATLKAERFVMSLTVERGAAVVTPGDVVTVSCLNRGTDQVLQAIQNVFGNGVEMTVVTSLADSISRTSQQALIDSDVDEGIWEEMESGLVHHGRLTVNYVALMALGGAVAAAGLYADSMHKTVAFIAASIIAPGYEPIAKIPLSLVLRRWPILRNSLLSVAVGYGVLIAVSALTLLGLQAFGGINLGELASTPEVRHTTMPTLNLLILSACAATAGAVMVSSFRETVLAGPLIGLALIPVASMLGGAIAAWNPTVMWGAVKRLFLDISLVIVFGYVVFWLKQRFVHRRAMIV